MGAWRANAGLPITLHDIESRADPTVSGYRATRPARSGLRSTRIGTPSTLRQALVDHRPPHLCSADSEARRMSGVVIRPFRSEEHTSELQSLMRISYAVFCLKNKNNI